jgi:hypothetical protein
MRNVPCVSKGETSGYIHIGSIVDFIILLLRAKQIRAHSVLQYGFALPYRQWSGAELALKKN